MHNNSQQPPLPPTPPSLESPANQMVVIIDEDDADDVSVDAMGWEGMGQSKVGQYEDEWLLLYYSTASQGRHIDKHLTIADHLCCIK